MNLTKANYLEYVLYLFKSYASRKSEKEFPTYRVVWKNNDDMFLGNSLSWDAEYQTLVQTKFDTDFEPHLSPIFVSGSNKDNFPTNVRSAWVKKYDAPYNNFVKLYSTPAELLIEAVNFVNSLNFDDSPLQPYFKDFESLTTGVKLPFLLVSQDIDLTPVSLVKVEEN
ncbi:hypothetical protein ACRXID_03875 [Ligilactobacillus animalis]|uniref:Uncharacterized protein n=1 Tax=Ligilactobacillus animalis TaxID=1605 RepID=A0ABR4RRT0_9LACO|nr:hypothetical protein [Ligilactobacillus animalis]KDA46386.1 hypothetical protein Lani381_0406 [Ligilactobacillus animalis]PNQ52682.1 hypothetical protein C0L91_04075 [Ligilactobacillus animalis]